MISASPGIYGGVRSLQLAQQLFLKLGCHVVPGQCTLPHADKAFDSQGSPTDPSTAKSVQTMAVKLVRTASRMGA